MYFNSAAVVGARKRALLTQADLAGMTGMSEEAIRLIEAGITKEPRPGTIRKLMEALPGLTVETLMVDAEDVA